MRRKLTLLLCLLPALVLGQGKVHLEFSSAGTRVGWVSDHPSAPPTTADKWDGQSYDLKTGNAKPEAIVQILDAASGNLASKPLGSISKGWLVKDADFNLIGHVRVRVEHLGAPVEVANVSLNDGNKEQSDLIDASAKGVADFYNVKPGSLKISVTYHSGEENKTQKQSFDEALKRDDAVPLLVVSVTNPVLTLQPGGSGTGSTSGASSGAGTAQKPQPPASKGLADWFLYAFVVLLIIAVIYFGFSWLQKNQDKAQSALNRFGVTLQDPTPATVPGNAVTPVAPQPQPQILLPGSDPVPLTSAPAPAPSLGGAPHFVGPNGQNFQLADGVAVVGRDPGLGISLVGESSVSRKHAEIVKSGSTVLVRDAGSTNGTFVNGLKVDGETVLKNGDTVQFGTVRLRFES